MRVRVKGRCGGALSTSRKRVSPPGDVPLQRDHHPPYGVALGPGHRLCRRRRLHRELVVGPVEQAPHRRRGVARGAERASPNRTLELGPTHRDPPPPPWSTPLRRVSTSSTRVASSYPGPAPLPADGEPRPQGAGSRSGGVDFLPTAAGSPPAGRRALPNPEVHTDGYGVRTRGYGSPGPGRKSNSLAW